MSTNLLRIGVIAKRSGLSVETIRFYEQQGLITPTTRSPSGYRLYTSDILHKLAFIQRSKNLGFSLQEIAELMQLQSNPSTPASAVKEHVDTKLSLVRDKIQQLQALEKSLLQLSTSCQGDGSISNCPIIDYLQKPID